MDEHRRWDHGRSAPKMTPGSWLVATAFVVALVLAGTLLLRAILLVLA